MDRYLKPQASNRVLFEHTGEQKQFEVMTKQPLVCLFVHQVRSYREPDSAVGGQRVRDERLRHGGSNVRHGQGRL